MTTKMTGFHFTDLVLGALIAGAVALVAHTLLAVVGVGTPVPALLIGATVAGLAMRGAPIDVADYSLRYERKEK